MYVLYEEFCDKLLKYYSIYIYKRFLVCMKYLIFNYKFAIFKNIMIIGKHSKRVTCNAVELSNIQGDL